MVEITLLHAKVTTANYASRPCFVLRYVVRLAAGLMILLFVASTFTVPIYDHRHGEPILLACVGLLAASAFRLRQGRRKNR